MIEMIISAQTQAGQEAVVTYVNRDSESQITFICCTDISPSVYTYSLAGSLEPEGKVKNLGFIPCPV